MGAQKKNEKIGCVFDHPFIWNKLEEMEGGEEEGEKIPFLVN